MEFEHIAPIVDRVMDDINAGRPTEPTDRIEHYYQDLDGWFWFEVGYRRMVQALPSDWPSVFVEIGSYKGKSAAFLAVEIWNSKKPVTMHCVDSWKFPTPDEGALNRQEFGRNLAAMAMLMGERFVVHAMPSLDAAAKFPNGSLDCVWIDGDHAYEACKADILAWWPKLREGGYMGGDDFMMGPVAQAVIDMFGENYLLGHGWATNPAPTPWPFWFVRKAP